MWGPFCHVVSVAMRMYLNRDEYIRSKEMRLRNLWLLLALVVLMAPLAAQERFGGLSGTVQDPQKLAVPGATVTVTNKVTGVARSVVTTADGSFNIPELAPGRYSVTVELQGFQKATADDVLV